MNFTDFGKTPMKELRENLEKMIEPHLDYGDSHPTSEPFYTLDHLIYFVRKEYIPEERKKLEEAWQAGYNAAMAEVVLKTFKKGI